MTIAGAALTQAEWETRYAITRNFFTVQYIRSQEGVIDEVLVNLTTARKRAWELYKTGNPDIKINKPDIDTLDINIVQVKGKKAAVKNGTLKALAALREAMGLNSDYPLEIANVELPAAVYPVKYMADDEDEKGKKVKVEKVKYLPRYSLESKKAEFINAALANRGEMTQANAASVVVELEALAQGKIRGYQGGTFAQGGDIHVQPIPQGSSNGDYKPGAFSLEMPSILAGRKADRVHRASDLAGRARAVVDKAHNLVSLDVEVQYLKWQEAVEDIQNLSEIQKVARELPGRVEKLAAKDFTSAAVIQANITAIMVRTQLNEQMHMHALALAGLERATAGYFRIYDAACLAK